MKEEEDGRVSRNDPAVGGGGAVGGVGGAVGRGRQERPHRPRQEVLVDAQFAEGHHRIRS